MNPRAAAMRYCNWCKKMLPESEFYRYRRTDRPGNVYRYDYICKECKAVRNRIQNQDRSTRRERRNEKPGDAIKIAVRRTASRAIQSGFLFRKPCEICGNEQVESHHEDYKKPLEVRWLCQSCHRAIHRKYHKVGFDSQPPEG